MESFHISVVCFAWRMKLQIGINWKLPFGVFVLFSFASWLIFLPLLWQLLYIAGGLCCTTFGRCCLPFFCLPAVNSFRAIFSLFVSCRFYFDVWDRGGGEFSISYYIRVRLCTRTVQKPRSNISNCIKSGFPFACTVGMVLVLWCCLFPKLCARERCFRDTKTNSREKEKENHVLYQFPSDMNKIFAIFFIELSANCAWTTRHGWKGYRTMKIGLGASKENRRWTRKRKSGERPTK